MKSTLALFARGGVRHPGPEASLCISPPQSVLLRLLFLPVPWPFSLRLRVCFSCGPLLPFTALLLLFIEPPPHFECSQRHSVARRFPKTTLFVLSVCVSDFMSDCVLSSISPRARRRIMRGGFTSFCPIMNRANSLNYKPFITNFELLYDLKSRQVELTN
ncbi:hypothetical protein L596_026738 [Steinernema carpocapsae]|uniref:Uncharacterized protein n=1 Tax=Steinernema carpocapsae TaxID=34508 RepID=A0A4U5M293_STECR|nr:hypothetical protein L596_026738 [Steinernema carpocapsae]